MTDSLTEKTYYLVETHCKKKRFLSNDLSFSKLKPPFFGERRFCAPSPCDMGAGTKFSLEKN